MAATITNLAEYIRRRQAERRETRAGLQNFLVYDEAGPVDPKIWETRPATLVAPMPGDGPWELQRFGDWLFAVSSAHGLYYLDGATWQPVMGVMGPPA